MDTKEKDIVVEEKVDEKVNSKNGNKRSNGKSGRNGSNKKNGNGNRYKGKDKRPIKGKVNDFSWWFKDPELASSVLSLPNTGISGLPVDLGLGEDFKFYVPGIMALHTVHGLPPTLTDFQNGNNAVNIAATQLFQDITRRNSRPPVTYNKQDLMVYYLAVNEINAFLSYCMRAYGAMLYWKFRNKYVPIKLFEAMGLKWESFRTHEMEFYNFMKEFTIMASSLPVPNAFDYFKRSAYVYSAYYSDGSSSKAQIYMNVPALFRYYDPTHDDEGSRLTAQTWCTGHTGEALHTLDDLKNMGWKLINALVNDEDIAIMGSDILRAYGVENCFQWTVCPIDFTLEPIADNYLYLEQVHNANINYFIDPTDSIIVDSFSITTDADDLTINYEPTMQIASSDRPAYVHIWNDIKPILDFKGNDIRAEDWFYATMWRSLPRCAVSGADVGTYLYFWGEDGEQARTELICGATIFAGDNRIRIWSYMEVTDANVLERANKCSNLVQFDWHPPVILFHDNGGAVDWLTVYYEMENYSDIPKQQIYNINRAALYGIWGLTDRHINSSKS